MCPESAEPLRHVPVWRRARCGCNRCGCNGCNGCNRCDGCGGRRDRLGPAVADTFEAAVDHPWSRGVGRRRHADRAASCACAPTATGCRAPNAPTAPIAPNASASAPESPIAMADRPLAPYEPAPIAPIAPIAPVAPIAPIAPVIPTSLEDVISRAIPAIVSIETGQGRGSGFFVGAAHGHHQPPRHPGQRVGDGAALERPNAAGAGRDVVQRDTTWRSSASTARCRHSRCCRSARSTTCVPDRK